MCGIVGFITSETKKLESDRSKFMRQGLIIDTLRGDDSTGCFAVGHEPIFDDGSAFWAKQVGPGQSFVDSENYWKSLYDTEDYRAMVGHNRAATVGKVDTAGAHPFQVGPITLVHNGTLRQTHSLPTPMHQCMVPTEKEGISRKVDVDSHAIACNLAEHDAEEVIGSLRGAFALVWHDARDNSVNIIRNGERPLHLAMSNQQDTLYFMSEGAMLHMLGSRLKLGLSGIYYPKPGQWLRWEDDTPLDAPHVKNVSLDAGYDYGRGGAGNYSRYGGYTWDDEEDDYSDLYGTGTGSSAMTGGDNKSPLFYPPHSPKEDYVFVGGRRKPVPMLLQEELLKYDLVVEDRLAFEPLSVTHKKGERCEIRGRLDGKYEGILLSQTEATSKLMERNWTVRPIAVQVTPLGTPLVLLKLVSTIWNGTIQTRSKPPLGRTTIDSGGNGVEWREGDIWFRRYHGVLQERHNDGDVWVMCKTKRDKEGMKAVLDMEKEETTTGYTDGSVRVLGGKDYIRHGGAWYLKDKLPMSAEEAYQTEVDRLRSEEDKVRGPFGSRITKDEFRRRVLDGCVVCTRPIGLDAVDDVIWADDGKEVLCGDCDLESYIGMFGDKETLH